MSVNGKGTKAEIVERRPIGRFVKFRAVNLNGEVSQVAYPSQSIKYMDADRRDGTTIVFLKTGGHVHVQERISEAANQWGQREDVVRYERMLEPQDIRSLGIVLRAYDTTGIEVSSQDRFTVLVWTDYDAVFPVRGKFERVLEKASYCRPYAVLTKLETPLPVAIPLDTITNVCESSRDGATMVKTPTHIYMVSESVDETLAVIARATDAFNEAELVRKTTSFAA